MAGDFIMVQHATPRKPEVLRIATILGIPPWHAFGLCCGAWMWFDEQTADGVISGATAEMLDAYLGVARFAHAMITVDWLVEQSNGLVVPNFERLMGESAKKRAGNTKRQQKLRCRGSVAQPSRSGNKKARPKKRREEKRKEEYKDKNTTAKTAAERAEVIYAEYPKKAAKPDALKAIERAMSKLPFESLLDAVKEFAKSPKGQGEFCPYPATWFNQERWNDDRAEWNRSGDSRSRATTYGSGQHFGDGAAPTGGVDGGF